MNVEKLIRETNFQKPGVSSKFHNYYTTVISLIKRTWVLFWHNLSLDPRVRVSPYHPPPENEVKLKINAIIFYRGVRAWLLAMHIISVITLICGIQGRIKAPTIIFGVICWMLSAIGNLAGSHRYWTHNSFSATLPLELFLLFCNSVAAQFSAFHWARVHRTHHKHSDTIADPHNANAGFFFCHIGWIMIRRTPECQKAMEEIWLDDLRKNKLVMFQHKYWPVILPLFSFIIPTAIPIYFWNEHWFYSMGVTTLRYAVWMHCIELVNSVAHLHGMRPFDKTIKPSDSWFVWFLTFGDEGWHNYHHTFPCDYKASEIWGYAGGMNTAFIELCARFGLAYDLKTTSPEVAMKRRQRTGDLTCPIKELK